MTDCRTANGKCRSPRWSDARRAAGEHHDAVGLAVRLHLSTAQLRKKPDEADRHTDEHNRQRRDDSWAQPAPWRGDRRFRRFIVGLQTHAMPMIPPQKSRTFLDEVESGWRGIRAASGSRYRPAWRTTCAAMPRR